MNCKEHPALTLAVSALAVAGAASIAMMVTEKGRKLLRNLLNSAECCTDAAGTALRDIKSEMQDCFSAGDEKQNGCNSTSTSSN